MKKTISDSNMVVFVQDLQEAILDGWQIEEGRHATTGFLSFPLYSVDMERNDKTVEEFKAIAEKMTGKPKLTRNEILTNARAARAAKAAGKLEGDVAEGDAVLDLETIQ